MFLYIDSFTLQYNCHSRGKQLMYYTPVIGLDSILALDQKLPTCTKTYNIIYFWNSKVVFPMASCSWSEYTVMLERFYLAALWGTARNRLCLLMYLIHWIWRSVLCEQLWVSLTFLDWYKWIEEYKWRLGRTYYRRWINGFSDNK